MSNTCVICLENCNIPYKQHYCKDTCSNIIYHYKCYLKMTQQLNIYCAICKYKLVLHNTYKTSINNSALPPYILYILSYGPGIVILPIAIICNYLNNYLDIIQNIADNILTY